MSENLSIFIFKVLHCAVKTKLLMNAVLIRIVKFRTADSSMPSYQPKTYIGKSMTSKPSWNYFLLARNRLQCAAPQLQQALRSEIELVTSWRMSPHGPGWQSRLFTLLPLELVRAAVNQGQPAAVIHTRAFVGIVIKPGAMNQNFYWTAAHEKIWHSSHGTREANTIHTAPAREYGSTIRARFGPVPHHPRPPCKGSPTETNRGIHCWLLSRNVAAFHWHSSFSCGA